MKQTALRMVGALLFAAIMFGMLTGCSAKGVLNPKQPITIKMWHYYNGPQNVALETMVKEFNNGRGRELGVIVEAYGQGNNVNQLSEKLMDSSQKKVGSEELPDIFSAYQDTAYQLDKLGVVAELDGYFTKDELSQYVQGYLSDGRFDENKTLKIFPIAKSTEIMIINKTDWDKFAAATGESLDSLSTIEGLVKAAESYYDWSGGKAMFGRDAIANYCLVGLKQMGQQLVNVSGKNAELNLNEQAFKRLWEGFYVPFVKGHFASYGKFSSDDAKTGDIIALVGSTSGAAYFPEKIVRADNSSYEIESLILPAPIFSGGERVAIQQGAGMAVKKSDEQHERAAVEFIKWFTDSERNLQFSALSGYMPVKTEANDIKILEKLKDSTEELSNNMLKALASSMETATTHTMFTSDVYDGSDRLRNILDDSLIKRAKADRETVLQEIAGGKEEKEALEPFISEESFRSWFKDLSNELNSTLQ